MEAIKAESEGKIHMSPDLRVYPRWKIPREMRARRKRSQFFKVHAGYTSLLYTGGMFYVNVRLAIDPSLAKLANRIYNLQHQLAIITDINLHPLFLARKKTTSATPWLVI